MSKILIFGNSGSGKSTLAKDLASKHDLGHLDLDTVAWEPSQPTIRRPQDEAKIAIKNFTDSHPNWVIEGCYADLLGLLTNQASEAIFLNLSIQACIANAKSRSWEESGCQFGLSAGQKQGKSCQNWQNMPVFFGRCAAETKFKNRGV